MDRYPMTMECFDDRVLSFIWDYDSGVPSCAPIDKVENCVSG